VAARRVRPRRGWRTDVHNQRRRRLMHRLHTEEGSGL
jgi:hypothetical protein